MEPTTPPPLPPRGNWWSRNWKWFVPTGCLGVVALFVAFFAIVIFAAFGMLKSTDVYKTALQRAKSNAAVTAALGTPVRDGLFVTGSSNTNGASGDADFAIPISGPKGKATIYVVAARSADAWTYKTLAVEIDATRQRIDLREHDGAEGE